MFFKKYKKRIKELELERDELVDRCRILVEQLHRAEMILMKIQELKTQEWTIDPSKTRKYN